MFLSSSVVKEIASFGGDISGFVSPAILEKIKNRLCPNTDAQQADNAV